MGQLSSVEYGYHKHDRCGKCGMAEKDGCCDTELKVVKLQDSHQWAKSFSLFKKVINVSSYNSDQYTFLIPRSYQPYISGYHSPPDRRDNEVYLHNGVLLI
jgi:hypothetical protein